MVKRKVRNFDIFSSHTWFVPGIAGFFAVIAFFILGAIIGNIVNMGLVLAAGEKLATSYGMLIAYPLMFIPAMIFASGRSRENSYNCSGRKIDSSHFAPFGFALCALIVSVLTIAISICVEPVTELLPPMPEFLKKTLEGLTKDGVLWVNFICVSLFAPFFEEWLCRGMVLRGLLNNGVKPMWSIVISAIFFAVIHLNPWQAIPAFTLGLAFGYVYYKTGSIKLTMLMHFVNNTCSLAISQIPEFELKDTWMDLFGKYYWLLFAAFILLIILIFRALSKICCDSKTGNCDKVPALFSE